MTDLAKLQRAMHEGDEDAAREALELTALRQVAEAATHLTAVLPDVGNDTAAHAWLYTLGQRLIEWQKVRGES